MNKWKNEAILAIHKNGQYAKAIAFAKSPLWVKIKIAKKMPKTTLESHNSWSRQKTSLKKNQ